MYQFKFLSSDRTRRILLSVSLLIAFEEAHAECIPEALKKTSLGNVSWSEVASSQLSFGPSRDLKMVGSPRTITFAFSCGTGIGSFAGFEIGGIANAEDGFIYWGNAESKGRLLLRVKQAEVNGTAVALTMDGRALTEDEASRRVSKPGLIAASLPSGVSASEVRRITLSFDVSGYWPANQAPVEQISRVQRVEVLLK